MKHQYWKEPVDLTLPEQGHRRTITATSFACECLLTLWPERRGPMYFAALATCTDAMRGRRNPAKARVAFIRAAREAGILG